MPTGNPNVIPVSGAFPPGWFPGSDGKVANPSNIPFWTPQQTQAPSPIPPSLPPGSQLFYSSAVNQTTVVQDLGSILQVASITGMPVQYPFKLLLEWGTSNQEVVVVTQGAALTGTGAFQFASCMRGQDGGGGQIIHAPGSQVNHGVSAADFSQIVPVFNVCAYGADPSGITDSTNGINAAINACGAAGGGIVEFPAGVFTHSGALLVNYNNVTLKGAGWGGATSLQYRPGPVARQAAIVVGVTGTVFNSNVIDLAINAGTLASISGRTGNVGGLGGAIQAGSGHGIVFRSVTGLIRNVTVNYTSGDGIHMGMDTLTTQQIIFDVTIDNCYIELTGGDCVYVDPSFYDCEFSVVRCEGGGFATVPFGGSGFNIQGTEIKLLNCHAYYCNLYGAFIGNGAAASSNSIIGGEMETNVLGNIYIGGSQPVNDMKIIGVDCHGNTGTAVDITINNSTGVVVSNCQLNSALTTNTNMLIDTSTGVIIANNVINAPTSNVGIYVQGNSTYINIHHNYINTLPSASGQTIQLAGATNSDVAFNYVAAGATESGSSNFNRIYGNTYPGGAGFAQFAVIGANSVMFLNMGTNVSSTSTLQQSLPASITPISVTAAAITSISSMAIPDAEPTVGAVYRFTAHGTMSTTTGPPNFILDIRYGGTGGTLITSIQSGTTAPALTVSLVTVPILIEGQIEFVTTGGTVVGWLRVTWRNSTTATTAHTVAMSSITTAVAVNSNVNATLTADWTWSGTGNTLLISSSISERVA